jgi:hypothetical protein
VIMEGAGRVAAGASALSTDLEEVGESERADVTALGADLALKLDDDGTQIVEAVAQALQFIPHSHLQVALLCWFHMIYPRNASRSAPGHGLGGIFDGSAAVAQRASQTAHTVMDI